VPAKPAGRGTGESKVELWQNARARGCPDVAGHLSLSSSRISMDCVRGGRGAPHGAGVSGDYMVAMASTERRRPRKPAIFFFCFTRPAAVVAEADALVWNLWLLSALTSNLLAASKLVVRESSSVAGLESLRVSYVPRSSRPLVNDLDGSQHCGQCRPASVLPAKTIRHSAPGPKLF